MTTQNFTEEQLREALAQRLKNGEMTKEQASAAIQNFRQGQRKEGGVFSAVWEPTKAIAGAAAGQVIGGLAGLGQLATGGTIQEASDTVEGVQNYFSEAAQPQTQAGINSLENIGQLSELGLDVARFPISGLGGLSALVTGKSMDDAATVVRDIQDKGLGQTAGDAVFERTGSPLLATVTSMSPELVATAIPIVGKARQVSKFQRNMANRIMDSRANPQLAQDIAGLQQSIQRGEMTDALFPRLDEIAGKSPLRIQNQLVSVADDVQSGVDKGTIVSRLGKIADDANSPSADKELSDFIIGGSGRAASDPNAREAIRQGFDQGVIASVKSASPEDIAFMREMVDIKQRGKNDALFAVSNRPTDVVGNNLLNRVTQIKRVNREAARNLDAAAEALKGQNVDFSVPVNNFLSRLEQMDIKLDSNMNPIFEGSMVEGLDGPSRAITNIINRMKRGAAGQTPDAHDLHRLKKYIDEQVTYGKTAEGLSGRTEGVLKSLRHEIDEVLDSNFDEYNAVNTTYSDTVGALDALQSSVGGKIDIFGEDANKALGTVLRGMMSNNRGRIELSNAIGDIESVSRQYGGTFNDNLRIQMLFADELDSVFGTAARTSLQGALGEGVKYGVETVTGQKSGLGILADVAGSMANRARNINEENAFGAIKRVLEQ